MEVIFVQSGIMLPRDFTQLCAQRWASKWSWYIFKTWRISEIIEVMGLTNILLVHKDDNSSDKCLLDFPELD